MNAPIRPALLRPVTAPLPADAADALPSGGRLVLALHAAVLSCARLDEAAGVVVRELVRRLGVDQAALALARDDGTLVLCALSDGSAADQPGAVQRRCLAALGETFDQRAAVRWPDTPGGAGTLPRITLAHQVLAGEGGSAAGVPLVVAGRPIGALCVRRHGSGPIERDELALLDDLASLTAPVLALMQAGERSGWRRLADAAAGGRRAWRLAGGVAAGVVLLALLWPVGLTLGGLARLEGAVQQVLAAPADGFIGRVHARPGDRVAAGQALVELADEDLQLERQRWQSQLAQHEDAWVAANARADRAQLVQQRSRADEAEAQLALVETRLQQGRLVAPFDAIVVSGDPGQQLGAPVRQGDALMTLAPSGRFRVVVEVDERDIAHVRAGQTGAVTLTALPWQTLPLRVVRIAPVARAVEGRTVFDVEAELTATVPADLRPGLQGRAQVEAGRASTLWRWSRRLVETLRLLAWEWLG